MGNEQSTADGADDDVTVQSGETPALMYAAASAQGPRYHMEDRFRLVARRELAVPSRRRRSSATSSESENAAAAAAATAAATASASASAAPGTLAPPTLTGRARSNSDASVSSGLSSQAVFFGVFDGHSGEYAAQYASEHLFESTVALPEFKRRSYGEAFASALQNLDEKIMRKDIRSGATALALYISDEGQIVCANVGDSRAVLSRAGAAHALSTDHKPTLPTEQARIEKAGMSVLSHRIEGKLDVSRTLGDAAYKANAQLAATEQAVTCEPEMVYHDLTGDEEFIVMATDGVWGALSNEQVVEFVHEQLKYRREPLAICRRLVQHTLANGGSDNTTAVLVVFRKFLESLPDATTPPPSPKPSAEAEPAGTDGAAAPPEEASPSLETSSADDEAATSS